MKSAYTAIFVILLIVAVIWFAPNLKAGLLSIEPAPSPSPSATLPRPRFQFCVDGTPLTVVSADENQTNYKCGSGARGAYLNGEVK
jgi:hypothetical protein